MYGIAVEYGTAPPEPARGVCRVRMARQPGYRRRLALQADGWRRLVDLFLFATHEAAQAALAGDEWRELAAAHPPCRDAAPALLVSQCPYGSAVVLLRGKAGASRGDQDCWHDHLAHAEPESTLW
ncbi:MAG: hypothetical protein AVDCRST_MAG88-1087 [uncultured Thermomicrobiales bacterium]|uniref:Uncharacterized protein n=1 Tax=uncultured Thermomicrobiales bacterium TaxID=1645740 RepID=A0A6J4UN93_9BACT|nr:MAG: hypothetical protein AVDCRST_MAG88-1087 [uncultured Thermomicrobiales bacterium]